MPFIPSAALLQSDDLTWLFNVRDRGARGDGVTDDTAAIQATINAAVTAMASGGIIFFPPGKYVITSTLVIPTHSGGGLIVGCGPQISNPEFDSIITNPIGPQSILYWNGAVGGTMISGTGIQAWDFERITFVGRTSSVNANRAGIGFHLKYSASLGAGVGTFRSCSFYDMAVGCQMGTLSTDDGCADYSFDRCTWWYVDECLLVKHIQGVNYRFDSASAVFCKSFVHCENGGSILVNMLNTSGCGGTGATEWVFKFDGLGPNSASCIINGWRVELNTKQLIKGQYLGIFDVDGLEEAQADQNVSQFDVNGLDLVLRNGRLVTNDATNPTFLLHNGAGGQGAALHLVNMFFDVATWVFNDWLSFPTSQEVTLSIEDGRYGATIANLRLPDIGSHLEYGDVNHFGQTTNASSRWLTLNGSSSANYHNVCHIPVDSTWIIDAYIVGQEVGGGADVGSFQRRATVKNVAGTLSIIGAVQTIGTDQNTDGWAVDLQVDSTLDNVAVDVTGKASTTINWKAKIVGARADLIL